MDEFSAKVLNFIKKNGMLTEGNKVVVGFSGGADSTALLNVLLELKDVLKIEVYALHLNHGIRDEAGDDAKFCEAFCRDRGIQYKVVLRDVPAMAKETKTTLEEAGRKARYEAFDEFAGETGADYIAVAHHQNDVAETLLLNLSRGTGLHGGSGIRTVRDNIIRPLLCVSRDEIENYLREKEVLFCTDKTNLENDHTRNIIRNIIIPEFEDKINKRTVDHLARAAASFEKADDFVRSYAKETFDKIVKQKKSGVEFECGRLLREAEIIRENVVLMCFEKLVKNRKDICAVHVEKVLSLMDSTDGTSEVSLPYGLEAKRSYNLLTIRKKENRIETCPDIVLDISGDSETEIEIPGLGVAGISLFSYEKSQFPPRETYTKWFDYDRIQEVVFRTRRPGDFMYIEQGGAIKKKELKKFYTDEKIPQDERDGKYVLADGSSILWVPGYRMGAAAKVSEKTKRILAIKIANGGITNG